VTSPESGAAAGADTGAAGWAGGLGWVAQAAATRPAAVNSAAANKGREFMVSHLDTFC